MEEAVGIDEGSTVEEASQVMPGVLIRSEDNPKSMNSSKIAMGKHEEKTGSSEVHEVQAQKLTNGIQLVNGDNGLPNGAYTNGTLLDQTVDRPKPMEGVENLLSGQLPPEIEHITYGYISLSTFISRLAQDTFNGLTDVINDMSEAGPAQASNISGKLSSQVNGVINGESADSAKKKTRMLEFTQHRREQFVKALVLSRWSQQAEEVERCIDVKVWLDTQRRTYGDAVGWVGELKRAVEHTKMPNPDIKTALEALSLGKASWLPDVR